MSDPSVYTDSEDSSMTQFPSETLPAVAVPIPAPPWLQYLNTPLTEVKYAPGIHVPKKGEKSTTRFPRMGLSGFTENLKEMHRLKSDHLESHADECTF